MIMASGEMCLLMTNRPVTFGDKTSQRRLPVTRCLFGPPDPVETQRLHQEEMQRERERFQRRWNIDLDAIEAAVEKASKTNAKPEDVALKTSDSESRIPPLPSDAEDKLSTADLEKEKISRCNSTSVPAPTQKKAAICKKPSSKFQKRVRVASGPKRQTCLTEFWRSRRTLAFVFGKTKARAISLQPMSDLLEPPV